VTNHGKRSSAGHSNVPVIIGVVLVAVVALIAILWCCGKPALVATSAEHRDRGIWFVHATDPHLFLPGARDPDKATKETGEKQEKLNEKALSDALKKMGSLPEGDGPPAFLALTGDLGVDTCPSAPQGPDNPADAAQPTPATAGQKKSTAKQTASAPATAAAVPRAKSTEAPAKPAQVAAAAPNADCTIDATERSKQVTALAAVLGASPIHDIYLIAGNNDVKGESPADQDLNDFNKLIAEVMAETVKKGVRLHNLTSCYVTGGEPASCAADIAHTPYRLIGFPSYSFKNESNAAQSKSTQEKQFDIFQGLLDDARQKNKQILILSHIPETDDPYTLAQVRYTSRTAPKAIEENPKRPASSAWNVSAKILEGWSKAIASDSVVGILAGHLHDSHAEIYQQPYSWSTPSDYRAAMRKLYLAPPLAVKNQDGSPVQARGFALRRLGSDGIESRLYWYDSETGDFKLQGHPEPDHEGRHSTEWRMPHTVRWLWALADPAKSLERMAILLIAFLAAFLTVMQVWQIPPPDVPLATPANAGAQGAGGAPGGGTPANQPPAFNPSPFTSNLGKTVIAGLAGLAAETVLQAWEGKPSGDDKQFYIVWFVIFFFSLLILLASFRALGEAVRARLAMIHYVIPETKGQSSLDYWVLRFARWIFSLQVPLLTFLDTFLSLIQGKNQTTTRVFGDKIIEQQRNVTHVANTIRQHLNDLILQKMVAAHNDIPNPEDVRVNISVMSADQSNVFYVASAGGSASTSFPKQSVAWISVFTGKIRWFKSQYLGLPFWKDIVLAENADQDIPDEPKPVPLSTHYQQRHGDYEAFVMFPVPFPQRGRESAYVKGAIHISFRHQTDFDRFWLLRLTPEERRARAARKVDAEIHAAATEEAKQALIAGRAARIAALIAGPDVAPAAPVAPPAAGPVVAPPAPVAPPAAGPAVAAPAPAAPPVAGPVVAPPGAAVVPAVAAAATPPVAAPVVPPAADDDPVVGLKTYEEEERMLTDWCIEPDVRVALREAIVVLGELLRGFNENIHKISGQRH
jgi:hypothetical protein